MAFPYIFASLSGTVPGSDLDANFAACAFAADVTALTAVVTALPSSATPLKPLAGGTAGAAATLSKSDHQHPPQSAAPNLQTGVSYTLLTSDDGGVIDLSNVAAITLNLPNNLPTSFSCLITQSNVGQVTLTPAGGANLRNSSGYTKTRTQWSEVSLHVRSNAGGTAAEYVLSGDGA